MLKLQTLINSYFEERATLTPQHAPQELKQAVHEVMDGLDSGKWRIAEKIDQEWRVNDWLKKAVLLTFRLYENQVIEGNCSRFFDKLPLKFQNHTLEDFKRDGVRVVPPAYARRGTYIAPNCILMPSYINVGAYIDSGTMIDTWATIGSCAQIGKNVHISGGVGIGGVLEPLQANPTIIEDNCFIGARSEIVEGVIVEHGAVITMGVFIGQSTRIYDRETDEVMYGRVPAGAVVVPGTLPSNCGKYNLYSAIIVKRVDEKTLQKVGLNNLLREVQS